MQYMMQAMPAGFPVSDHCSNDEMLLASWRMRMRRVVLQALQTPKEFFICVRSQGRENQTDRCPCSNSRHQSASAGDTAQICAESVPETAKQSTESAVNRINNCFQPMTQHQSTVLPTCAGAKTAPRPCVSKE